MIKHRVIIGQQEHDISIPQGWEEVTWGQFKKICGKTFKNTDVEITEILTGHLFKGFLVHYESYNFGHPVWASPTY